MCDDSLDSVLTNSLALGLMFCDSVHTAGVCDAFGADGLWGERGDQPLQADANTHRSIRRTFSLCGVADSGWGWHQQAGQSSTSSSNVARWCLCVFIPKIQAWYNCYLSVSAHRCSKNDRSVLDSIPRFKSDITDPIQATSRYKRTWMCSSVVFNLS